MKILRIVTTIVILFTGCYSPLDLTRDQKVPADRTVLFYLSDGSYVKSGAEHHQQIERGYRISGDRWNDRQRLGSFDGVLQNFEIQKTVVYEFDGGRTLLAGGLVVGILAVYIALIWSTHSFLSF